MDSRNLDKALDIYSKLMMGVEVSRKNSETGALYEDYFANAEVYEILNQLLKKLNLHIYEYKDCLYLTPGESNRVFGYSNEELKRLIGLRNNRELYLGYFIIYQIILIFYPDSAAYQFREYIHLEDIVQEVTGALAVITQDLSIYAMEDIEENSFQTVALLWEELPLVTGEDREQLRASRASRMGFVKMIAQFLISQDLFVEVNGRYYPSDRLNALIRQYFEEYRGRIYEVLSGEHSESTYTE